MKKALILVTIFFVSHVVAFAQVQFDSLSNKIVYQGIVITKDSLSKEEIYKRVKQWMVTTLKSSDNMVLLDDKNFNSLTGTGNLKLQTRTDFGSAWQECNINFKFSVFCKDGRYKYQIENFTHSYVYTYTASSGTVGGTTQSQRKEYIEGPLENIKCSKKRKENVYTEINDLMLVLINELNKSINNSAHSENNW